MRWPVPSQAKYIAPDPLRNALEEYRDEVQGGFLKWFPELDLRGKAVLDIGSGYGGRTIRYKELGAHAVTGLEMFPSGVESGERFAELRGVEVTFVQGVGEALPFKSNSFDVITSYDVFEHVEDVEKVIRECRRVLKPQGTLYAVFPPFYHPTGSHFEGYLSHMPWANVLFTCKTLLEAAGDILMARNDGIRPNGLRPKDKLWALNGVTIGSFKGVLQRVQFATTDVEYAPLFSPLNSRWKSWRMHYYAFLFRPLRHMPLLNELFTHRIVCRLRK